MAGAALSAKDDAFARNVVVQQLSIGHDVLSSWALMVPL
jgi:hypothetical protein